MSPVALTGGEELTRPPRRLLFGGHQLACFVQHTQRSLHMASSMGSTYMAKWRQQCAISQHQMAVIEGLQRRLQAMADQQSGLALRQDGTSPDAHQTFTALASTARTGATCPAPVARMKGVLTPSGLIEV